MRSSLGTRRTGLPLTTLRPPLGVDVRLPVRFVYGKAVPGVADAGDPFDVSAYEWEVTAKRNLADAAPLWTLDEDGGIDASGAEDGELVLTISKEDIAKSAAKVVFDLVGTKAGDVWFAWGGVIEPERHVRTAFADGQAETLGAAVIRADDDDGGVTVAVTLTEGGGGTDARLDAVADGELVLRSGTGFVGLDPDTLGGGDSTHTKLVALTASRALAATDEGRRILLDGFDLTLPAEFAPDKSIYVFNPSASARTVAMPGGPLTVQPGEAFELVWLDASTAYAIAQPAIPFTA